MTLTKRGLAAVSVGMVLAATGMSASAHQDPPNCAGIDVSLRLTVTRSGGAPVVGTLTECETVNYRARLSWRDECLIAAGTLKLITPDGVEHVIANPLPCLGAATVNAEGCIIGQDTQIESASIPYTVSPADVVGGLVTVTARWEDGVLHQAVGNVGGQNAQRSIVSTVLPCDDGAFCTGPELCDPEATDGVRLGLCQPGTPPDCGTSDQCAERSCDEVDDACDEVDTSGRCGLSDFCVERGCLPATGCFATDNSDALCPDEFCTERDCDPAGGCIDTDVSAKCGTSDQCTDRVCDEVNDACDEVDTSGRCGLSDFCVERGCLPETGCFATDDSDALCPDEFCTERDCDPAGGCVLTDVSGKCGTSDECTDRSCDEVNDECDQVDTSGRCDDGDVCTDDTCDPETGCMSVENPTNDPSCEDCLCVVIIDEDTIDNDIKTIEAAAASHGIQPDRLVNDDRPTEVGNPWLRWNTLFPGDVVLLPAGQVDDEGLFAPPPDPPWSLEDYVAGIVPQSQLDKIDDVMPLRNHDLYRLIGRTCIAVVYDSDISMNFKPINGNLQGARYGLFAFTVLDVELPGTLAESGSSTSLYDLLIRVEPEQDGVCVEGFEVPIFDDEPDSIQFTRKRLRGNKLEVWATSNYAPAASMTISIDGFVLEAPMTYNAMRNRYEYTVTAPNLSGRRVMISTDFGGAYSDRI